MTFDQLQFRHVMGHFATGVTIVTAAHQDAYAGFTANAFTSVSLDPPLVLVCIGTQNASRAIIEASQAFCVNILSDQQEELARIFATNGPAKYTHLAQVQVHSAVTGAPILADTLAWLDCRLTATYPGGDHIILLGEVLALDAAPGEPLLYLRAKYRRLRK
jgi:flavin reductase (DIM6/NTAB) family NADH-FMN oxidoreductase RutF